jgi:lipopolysaccharide export system protein LptA
MNVRLFFVLAVCAGALRAEEPPKPTVITSDEFAAHSTDAETVSLFTNHVVATATNLKMTCDRMEVITTKVANKTDTVGKPSQFKHMVATGHVHIWQEDREATCGRAEVLPLEDKIILTENPSVTDRANGSVGTGDVIEIRRNQRIVTGTNVHFTLPAIKDLGFDKKQAPAAADAPPAPEAPASATAPTSHPAAVSVPPLAPAPSK